MNWTKKKPIEPGAYWLRNDGWARPVQIDEDSDGRLIVWQPGIDFPSRLADLRGEWAGPIPRPGEAKPAIPCADRDGNLCLSCAKPADHKPATCGECRFRGSVYGSCQRDGSFVAADAAACSKFKRVPA
jgi:hypothetical protein